jgi:hypothetical protein
MTKRDLIKLNTLDYFTKETLRSLTKGSEGVLSYDIARFIKSGEIIQFRKGIYSTRETYENNSRDISYKKLIANILRVPSYVSLETVLSRYNILTDVTYNLWSITLKVPRKYSNRLGSFHYKQMRKDLFTGYEVIERENGTVYYEATKAKALFDYIYYRSDGIKDLKVNLVEDLRLNLDAITTNEWAEFKSYIKHSDSKKLATIFENLKRNA